MTKIDDMALFAQVVKAGGLAAAGRQLGLSPASMTARLKALESRYDTRLLNRSTRSISLTEAGHRFYEACLRVVAEVTAAEATLQESRHTFSGTLRITAPSDFGRQYVAPALVEFVQAHPEVVPYLFLSENMVNLIAEGFDIGVRLGNLPDSGLMMRSLAQDNRRILCAAPAYLAQHGEPTHPTALQQHSCLVIERQGQQLNQWSFRPVATPAVAPITLKVNAALVGSDGALIRQWALAGAGIALKSYWDVKQDIAEGRLKVILNQYVAGGYSGDNQTVGLQLVYPSRKYLPRQVAGFIDFFADHMKKENISIS